MISLSRHGLCIESQHAAKDSHGGCNSKVILVSYRRMPLGCSCCAVLCETSRVITSWKPWLAQCRSSSRSLRSLTFRAQNRSERIISQFEHHFVGFGSRSSIAMEFDTGSNFVPSQENSSEMSTRRLFKNQPLASVEVMLSSRDIG